MLVVNSEVERITPELQLSEGEGSHSYLQYILLHV